MHEMSIAMSLIGQVLHQADANHLSQVQEIVLDVGEQRQIVPEALHMAFRAVAAETCAAGARLDLHEIPVRARCRSCGEDFAPAIDDYRCPACGLADIDFIQGNDIILRSLSGEQEE